MTSTAKTLGFSLLGLGFALGVGSTWSLSQTPSTRRSLRSAPHATGPIAGQPRLTREQVRQDLEDWYARLFAIHPDPTTRLSREELADAVDLAVAHTPETIDRATFFVLAASLAAGLGDCHTAVVSPPEFSHARLPLVVEQDALCLTSTVTGVPAGSCLRRLGSHSARDVLTWSRRLVSAQTPPGIDRAVPRVLPSLLHTLGYGTEVPAEFMTPSGAVVEQVLRPREQPAVSISAATMDHLPGSVVRLTVRTFADDQREQLLETFERTSAWIATHPTRGLVVDLRHNDGGNTTLAETLVATLGGGRHRMLAAKYWKVSQPMQQYIARQGYPAREYLDAEVGTAIVTSVEPTAPLRMSTPFAGTTVFLIGPGTLSAAMMLADAVAEYDLGILVGEPTASPPTYFGEIYAYTMPNSGLMATISSAAFLRASGDPDNGEPVMPDLLVPSTLADRLAGRDEPLAAALRIIEEQSSPSAPPPGPVSVARLGTATQLTSLTGEDATPH
ncbi:MAG: hypothetical protein K0V04_04250 [Deltaproteobacteria bacterium]|nr:hypothetical protein [Deltaproteobacteria bacterium]